MKVAIVVLCALFVTLASAAELGTCGGSCTSTALCASTGESPNCRCVNFVCSMTPDCGGGCVIDSQCSNWSGGDTSCVCTMFSCKEQKIANAPGYHPFLDIAMTKMSKEKREQVQPIKEE